MTKIKGWVKKQFAVTSVKLSHLRFVNSRKYYRKLTARYAENTMILIFPFYWMGDAFYLFSKLSHYIKETGIKSYVAVVMTDNHLKIAKIFGVNVEKITPPQMEKLVRYAKVVGDYSHLKHMHHNPMFMYCNYANNWCGYKNLKLKDMLDIVAFDGMHLPSAKPTYKKDSGYYKRLLQSSRLKGGNTVLISPYANTLKPPFKQFWIELSSYLLKTGYNVAVISSAEEETLEGLVSINVDIDEIALLAEVAGYFIGARSGVCDLLAFAMCRKIILYSEFCEPTDIDYFNINDIWENNSFEEIYMTGNTTETIEKIAKKLRT
ncbi:MAG: hypothetical protein LUI60_08190 [Clostridia bacterium]|nr:hypothetical protein [Clostridia bacterium]